MTNLIGKTVQLSDHQRKKGIIEHIDEKWIVVFWEKPRKERTVYPNNESFFDKVQISS